jgi:formylmethanofuran dehydrogenase subunit E
LGITFKNKITGEWIMKTPKIVYKPRLENRTISGDFGPSKCSKCGSKVTGYLEVYIDNELIMVLCKGCLYEGIESINNAMLKSYIK